MDDLLPYYENELVHLRRYGKEFAERYPKLAGRLHIGADTCADPHVERLIEATAMLAARLHKRLDDDYPEFTEGLLEMLLPHYLRSFPSCAIVQVDGNKPMPKGTELHANALRGVHCRFVSAYPIAAGEARIVEARFDPIFSAPSGTILPSDASACISLQIEAPGMQKLRVFLDGEASFCATLRDSLFMRISKAFVVEGSAWHALEQSPILPVGFAEEDALLPRDARTPPAYRLLTEYFAFPEKFNFIDIDLPAGGGCLKLVLKGIRADSPSARMLSGLSAANLRLRCTPVVNSFMQAAVPIDVTHKLSEYALTASIDKADAYEIQGVESAHMSRQDKMNPLITPFRPIFAFGHEPKGHYWFLRKDATRPPGHQMLISLIDADFDPLVFEQSTFSLNLRCTNGALATEVQYGQPAGDFQPRNGGEGERVQFLHRPSQACHIAATPGLHWRLLSHLSLNHHGLSQEGLPAFREMLTLYDLRQSPTSQRQIHGVLDLRCERSMAWMSGKYGPSHVPGLEIRMSIDEAAFSGAGIHLFSQVIEHFFGLYVQINCFTQLIVLSKRNEEELIRCKPRNGAQELV